MKCKVTVSIVLVSRETLLQGKMQLQVLVSVCSRNFVNLTTHKFDYIHFYVKTLYFI